MFSEQILSGFHEGVKALRLGVGKHLFPGQALQYAKGRSMPHSASKFEADGHEHASAPTRLTSLHAMSAKTVRRYISAQPGVMRDTV